MAETIQANADNDLKFRDGLDTKKPKKLEESGNQEAASTPKTEYFTE